MRKPSVVAREVRRVRAQRAWLPLVAAAVLAACTGEGSPPGPSTDPSPSSTRGKAIDFADVTIEAGIDLPPIPTWGAAFVDADLDGWPDVLVDTHKSEAVVLTNDDGRFEAATPAALNVPAPGRTIYDRHGCAWGEADADGRPDLYCGSGAQDGQGEGPNRLWVADAGGDLEDVAPGAGVADPLGRARSVNWLDHDVDGDLDIYVANEIRPGVPNRLYRNDSGKFELEESEAAAEIATRSSSWSDWDADGDPDLLVLGHGFVGSRAFENAGGVLREVTLPRVTGESWLSASWGELGSDRYPDLALVSEERLLVLRRTGARAEPVEDVRLRAGRVAQWLDVENDGDLDLFLVQGAAGDPPRPGAVNNPDSLWLNLGGNLLRTSPRPLAGPSRGNGDSAAVADFDRDGRMDLLVTNGYLNVAGPLMLLANRSRPAGWAAVTLVGGPGNPFGFGARVRLKAGPLKQWRQVTDGVAFTSQSETRRVHFGLGDQEGGEVEVVWPDGSRDCIEIASGDDTEVEAGSSPC